jgi:hypothetical protein
VSNAEKPPTGHGPEGCDENGPAAALLVGYVSIQICALLAPCRRPILIATKAMLSMDRTLTSGDCRKDAHFITWVHGRLSVLKKANIFVIHENVYEPANVILLIANAFFHTRVTVFQIVDYLPDGRTFDPNNFLILG